LDHITVLKRTLRHSLAATGIGTFETNTEPQISFRFWTESWPFWRLCLLWGA